MKILHTSDWHLGRYLHEHPLLEDQQHILDRLLEYLREEKNDILLISGDIYDRSVPAPGAVKLLSSFLFKARNLAPKMQICIIPGNHDSAARLGFGSELFEAAGIHFRTEPEKVDNPVRVTKGTETVDVYMLPFLYPGTYIILADDDELRLSHEDAVRTAVERIRQKMDTTHINILVAHMFTRGGQTSDSERTFVGTAGFVNPDILGGFDYVALGHLHRPQQIDERIFYSGSLLKYSFSEAGDEKRLLQIEVGGEREIKIRDVILNPLRDMKRLSGTFAELSRNNHELRNTYLEIELTDQQTVINPMAQLRRHYPYLLSLRQKLYDNSSTSLRGEITPGGNIEDDFLIFQDFLHESPPSEEKKKLFTKMLQEVRAHETA